MSKLLILNGKLLILLKDNTYLTKVEPRENYNVISHNYYNFLNRLNKFKNWYQT